jgi:hypothetical protein
MWFGIPGSLLGYQPLRHGGDDRVHYRAEGKVVTCCGEKPAWISEELQLGRCCRSGAHLGTVPAARSPRHVIFWSS